MKNLMKLSPLPKKKKIKRVVIKRKRGRGVPVLFSTNVQEHLE